MFYTPQGGANTCRHNHTRQRIDPDRVVLICARRGVEILEHVYHEVEHHVSGMAA
jgi:hypothetical protein